MSLYIIIAVEVIIGLNSAEVEASAILQKVVLVVLEAIIEETLHIPEALNIGMTDINLNFIPGDDFDYSTKYHKSPSPSLNPSPKHNSSSARKSII